MNVLFLSQGKKINDHPGWHDALLKLQKEGEITNFLNIPYFGYAEKYGWGAFYIKVVQLCKEEGYDIVYFHHFHSKIIPSPKKCLIQLKKLNQSPVIITSCGDGFSDNWMLPDYPNAFKEASSIADISFSTQMGRAADKMVNWGANNIVFSPLGMCQVRFKAYSQVKNLKKEFDFVLVGSKNANKFINPISKYWWASKKRLKLIKDMNSHFNSKFGLFGNGWDTKYSNGPIPFEMQQKIYQKGKFAIDAPPYSFSDYYTSNRHLFQIASGVPTIMFETPRIKKLFKENEHCYFISQNDSLLNKAEELLKINYDELIYKAQEAAKYIEENHTQYHRMKFKIDTVKRYIANNNNLDVQFPFFLPEVNLKEEIKYATRVSKI
ncbi:glycosyltransferase family protein [Gillisia limnaea]|uniref:Spore protein YkvP/CgeB glycosyl transferase-like domain-containing protein n=1 Tax=Gillisia limnaea (strain DSM 15749 / LMG 21470 / R-8282) TaxID=865937 RepID=H2C003_GILLR|nr:glycosyltransferase [Gillisia limnaea]EHQ02370.1 hypothetical protein Gilli_1727 [Gillisia limnaea DSM 15749]